MGEVFSVIGNVFQYIISGIGDFFNFNWTTMSKLIDLFGFGKAGIITNCLACLGVSLIFVTVYGTILDILCYLKARISKKCRKLSTKAEKKSYALNKMHFAIKAMMSVKNKFISFRTKKKNKRAKKRKNSSVSSSVSELVTEDEVKDIELDSKTTSSVKNSYLCPGVEIIPGVPFPGDEFDGDADDKEIVDTKLAGSGKPVIDSSEKSNIRIISSSNLLGNYLRKGVVLNRHAFADEKPILIDFTGSPKEVFTGHDCGSESGIVYRKIIAGEATDMFLDSSDFIDNPKLYDEISDVEKLKLLREKLQNDEKYRLALIRFFSSNDRAMLVKKK